MRPQVGRNLLANREQHVFSGQSDDKTNAYAGIKYDS